LETPLILQRVANHLDRVIVPHIDAADITVAGEERTIILRSRALAAFCVSALTRADPEKAAASVVDGYGDQGIDAVYFDKEEDRLYIVQSKWRQTGRNSVGIADSTKFIRGVRLLIGSNYSSFNERLRRRQQEIAEVLCRTDVDIILVLACSSAPDLADEIRTDIQDFIDSENGAGEVEVFKFEWFNLGRMYSSLSTAIATRNIKVQVGLSWWGTMKDPFRAYYGQMKLSDVARLSIFGKPLWHKNIRYYKGSTDVNEAMEKTLTANPDRFWYFNNGITILCRKVTKTPFNGMSTDWGIFECEDASVVNGAQTVGVVWEVARRNPALLAGSDAKVHVRLISLERCPPDFDTDLTTATNTQNRIEYRDFAALDPVQQRLAQEMALDGRHYAFKSGDTPIPTGAEGCDLEEATIALACASPDIALATLAKREAGSFYRNLKAPPYTTLFNEALSARDLWRAILISRAVDEELSKRPPSPNPASNEHQVTVHGNRFILHQVFQDPEVRRFRDPHVPEANLVIRARQCTPLLLSRVAKVVQEKFPVGTYLQPLFKSTERCKVLLDESDPTTRDLFE
jgi:hypothetical protein